MITDEYQSQLALCVGNILEMKPDLRATIIDRSHQFSALHSSNTPIHRQTKTWKRLHIKNVENYKYNLAITTVITNINRILHKFGRYILLLYRNPRLCYSTYKRLKKRIRLTRTRILIPTKLYHSPYKYIN